MDSISLTKEQAERPGAYVFWLGNVCQYVGGSRHCIARAAQSKHDTRGRWQRRGMDYDRIQFFFTQTEEQAWELEEKLAQSLRPKYGDWSYENWEGENKVVIYNPNKAGAKGKKWPAARRRHYELYGH